MILIRLGMIGCLLVATPVLRAQSPLVPLESPTLHQGMPVPTESVIEVKSEYDVPDLGYSAGTGFQFKPINYFDQTRIHRISKSWNEPSLGDGSLTLEISRELTCLIHDRGIGPTQPPLAIVGALKPLVASDSELNLPPQVPFPEPEFDARTRPTRAKEHANVNESALAHEALQATGLPDGSPVILDPHVQAIGFQEPSETKQDRKSNSDRDGAAAKQDPEQGDKTPDSAEVQLADSLKKQIQDQIELLKSNETLAENSKLEQLKQLNDAVALVLKAKSDQAVIEVETKKKNEFQTEEFQAELKARQDQLKEPSPLHDSPMANQNAAELEKTRDIKQAAIVQKKEQRDDFESEIKELEKRIKELSGIRTRVAKGLKLIKQNISELEQEPDKLAQRLILQAGELAAQTEIEKLDIESVRQTQRSITLPLDRTWITREITKLEMELVEWKKAYKTQKKVEDNALIQQAMAAKKKAINADEWLNELASRNLELTQESKDLTDKIDVCDKGATKAKLDFEKYEKRLSDVRDKIDSLGITKKIGIELVDFRNRIMQTVKSLERIELIRTEVQNCLQKELSLKKERASLADLMGERIEKREASGIGLTDPELSDAQFEDFAGELIEMILGNLLNLEEEYKKFQPCLEKEREQLELLVNKVLEAFEYIDENVLWVRSADPISLANLSKSKTAVRSFFDREKWIQLVEYAKGNVSPFHSALAGFIMVAIFVVSRRLKGNP